MNSEKVKHSLQKMSEAISFKHPATGWYFSSHKLGNAFVFKKEKWVCMSMYLKIVMKKGKKLRFSKDHGKACVGPAEYFGFKKLTGRDGHFIADTERFKKDRALARSYHDQSLERIHPPREEYLYMEKIENIDDDKEIEVINLFPDPTGLASLTVLSNYDRETNMDNVLTPFASGCQSVFTVPYNEKHQLQPKCVIGMMDPLARHFVPEDMISFSMPANRFLEMAHNIQGSFLDRNWDAPTGF